MSATDEVGEIGPGARVSYTVKELLDEQTGLLRSIDAKVDTKASKADIASLHARIDGHDTRIKGLEDGVTAAQAQRDARSAAWRRWSWLIAAVIVPLGVALILVFVRP